MKELKFIHITKTGGTSIEDIGMDKNIQWGRNHKEYGYWHYYFSEKPKKLKINYDWFLVVRNPYERILSEYFCKWGGVGEIINFINLNISIDNENSIKFRHQFTKIHKLSFIIEDINDIFTKEFMNKFLIEKIKRRNNLGDHYAEQYKYMDYNKDIQIHILKFENLKNDFDNLMKTYNIDLTLDVINNKSPNKIFTINDFSKELIELINVVYLKDFEIFNYKKIII